MPDTALPPLDQDLAASLLAAVDAGFEAQVDTTRALIRHPSLRGQEHTAQDFMYQAMSERGLTLDRWRLDPEELKHHPGFSPVKVPYDNAFNVVGTHRPRAVKGRSLVMNGHIDVVPTGPLDMWKTPPFEPHVEGDWLYGRGSGDMKAGLVANLFALDALRSLGLQPAATVYMQSVTEEECTGNGALACHLRGYQAEAAVIPEPEDDMLVRANTGVIWFQVMIRGEPVHVREASSGSNAILAAYRVIEQLKALEERWNAKKAEVPYFAEVAKPININVGKIAGGDWASSVPAWCTLDVRAAIYPGVEPKDAAREIEAAVRAAGATDPFLANNPPEVVYNGFFAKGYILEEGSEAEATLAAAYAQVHGGQDLQSFVTPGYLDGRVFVIYDGIPCLVYGPYSENIHGFNERVSLDSLRRVTKTLALYLAAWCGVESV
ncbi:MAG: ArgE/DapE family deacylase [Pseudomonadota bacterium]